MFELLALASFILLCYAVGITGERNSLKVGIYNLSRDAEQLREQLGSAKAQIRSLEDELKRTDDQSEKCAQQLQEAWRRLEELE